LVGARMGAGLTPPEKMEVYASVHFKSEKN